MFREAFSLGLLCQAFFCICLIGQLYEHDDTWMLQDCKKKPSSYGLFYYTNE